MKLESMKPGMYLLDDARITYRVIEVFTQSAVVQALDMREADCNCEIMTFEAMNNEKWILLKSV